MTDDWQLIERYRATGDNHAFEELTARYLNLVWSAAFRITRDAEQARDIAQTVFADFSRKAKSIPRQTILPAWFHKAACFAACHAVRSNSRRAAREREATRMQEIESRQTQEEQLAALFPMLDQGISQLREADREAILLRFFRQQPIRGVGQALGISEAAAEKRIGRAVQKLRLFFRRRGVETSAVVLASALGAAGTQAAPAGIAAAILASSAAAGTASAAAASSSGILQLLHQLPASFATMKTQLVITSVIMAGFTGTYVAQQNNLSALRRQNSAMAEKLAQLPPTSEVRSQLQEQQNLAAELEQLRKDHAEFLRLRDETAQLKASQSGAMAQWQKKLEDAQSLLSAAQTRASVVQAERDAKIQAVKSVDDLKHLGLAARIFATDHQDVLPTDFSQILNIVPALDLSAYEFIPHSRAIAETEPEVILFREKQPRRQPDGTWSRAYTLVDGSVQQVSSPDGDFHEWESKHQPASTPPAGAVANASAKQP